MFGGTIWVLLSRRSTHQVNRKMLTVACLLLVFSTVVSVSFVLLDKHRTEIHSFLGSIQHLAIHIIRAMDGLILYRDTYPGGPIGYFSDVSQWTFVSKNHVYTAQTLIGDGVIVSLVPVEIGFVHSLNALQLYRCYVVWQSKLVMTLPVLFWLAAGGSCATCFGVTEISNDFRK